MTKRNDKKLTFFENIFYWLWYSLLKLSKRWYTPPHLWACIFVTTLKVLNFIWFIMLLGAISRNNILKTVLGDSISIIVIATLIIGYLIMRHDEKKYGDKADLIAQKMERLAPRERSKRKYIFYIYIIISLGVWSIADKLVSVYN